MAGHNYLTKGYSTYTDIPGRKDGYNHGNKLPVHGYVTQVETTTVERVLRPVITNYNYSGSPSKVELLKEYVYSPDSPTTSPTKMDRHSGYGTHYGSNYGSTSPIRYHGRDDGVDRYGTKSHDPFQPARRENFSSPNHYGTSSPVRNHGSEEVVDKFLTKVHTEASRPSGNYSGQNKHWQTAGPPATRHPLTTSTNDINEAVSFLKEAVSTATHAGPKRSGGVLDDLSTRMESVEPARRYARPAFGGTSNKTPYNHNSSGNTYNHNTSESTYNHNKLGSTIDSKEAVRKYRGALVP